MKVKAKALLVFKGCDALYSSYYKEEFPFGVELEVKRGVLYGVDGGFQLIHHNTVSAGDCTLLFEEV